MFYRKLMLSTILIAYPMLARGATDVDKLFDNLDKDSNLDDHHLKLNHKHGHFVENMVVFAGGADFNYSQVMSAPDNVIKLCVEITQENDPQCSGAGCIIPSEDSPYGECSCATIPAIPGCVHGKKCVNNTYFEGYDSTHDSLYPRRPSKKGNYRVPEI